MFFGGNEDFLKFLEMPRKMIRKPAPKFTASIYSPTNQTKSELKLSLSDFAGKYLVLFFYPNDFTAQSQEEILDFSKYASKFKNLNCDLLGCSTDSTFSHKNFC